VRHLDVDTLLELLLDAKLRVDGARGLVYVIERRLVHLSAEATRDGLDDEAAEYASDAMVLRHTRLSR
jgi:hypothetical protein